MLTIWPKLIVAGICMKNKSRHNSQSLVTNWLLVALAVSPLCSTDLYENLQEAGFAKITFSSFFLCEIFGVFVYNAT